MAGGKIDAGELLVRALDQVVGGIALARYAATQTNDDALRGVFNRLVAAGEQQERLLRRHLSGYPGPLSQSDGPTRSLLQFGVGATALAAGFGAAALAYRAYRSFSSNGD